MPDPILQCNQLDLEEFADWLRAGGNTVLELTDTERGNNFWFKWRTDAGVTHVLYHRFNGRMNWSSRDAMLFVTEFLQGAAAVFAVPPKVQPIRPGISPFSDTLVEGFADKLAKLRAEGVNPTGVVVVFFEDNGTTGIHWNTVHSVLPTKAVLGITLAAVTNLIAEE